MRKLVLALAILVLSFNFVYAGQDATVADLKAWMQFETRGNLDVVDSIWYVAINKGMEDLATTVDCTIDTHKQVLSVGTAIYDLPADALKLRRIRDMTTGRALDIIQAGQEGKAGTGTETEEPKVSWTTRGVKQMIWYPAPVAADSVIIYYCKSPTVVDSDTNTLSIAPPFHPALISACLKALYKRLERWDASNNYAVDMIHKINLTEAWLARPGPDVEIGKRVIGRTE